jgi:hypothetical protein
MFERLLFIPTREAIDGTMQTAFSQRYPNITHWIDSLGWIEIGQDEYSQSFVRLLNQGGMVWESEDHHETIDEALQALETDLVEILKEWE